MEKTTRREEEEKNYEIIKISFYQYTLDEELYNLGFEYLNYAKKLYSEIKYFEKLLSKMPYIGHQVDLDDVRRVIILKKYSIYYIISEDDKKVFLIGLFNNLMSPSNNRRNLKFFLQEFYKGFL